MKRYLVWCETCYKCHLSEHTSKKEANVAATSHMNSTHHSVHIQDRAETAAQYSLDRIAKIRRGVE